jgi:probable F420-dependent oxidoreductase
MDMRFGAKIPDFGPQIATVPIREASRRADAAGWDSVWVSDHVVMVDAPSSPYPFSDDGSITWDLEAPRLEAVVALSVVAAVTERVEIGVAVLIAAMRNPVVLAKQLATIDVISDGRLSLGVGAGWLEEEFVALDAPFEDRGDRLDTWIELMRSCWTGRPREHTSRHYVLPAGVVCQPVPAHDIPILVGGTSPAAVRRAANLGDGWLGFSSSGTVDYQALQRSIHELGAGDRVLLRLTGPLDEVVRHVAALEEIGVTDLIVEVDWGGGGPERTLERLREAAT